MAQQALGWCNSVWGWHSHWNGHRHGGWCSKGWGWHSRHWVGAIAFGVGTATGMDTGMGVGAVRVGVSTAGIGLVQ